MTTTQQPEPDPIAWATLGEDGGVSMLFPTREEAASYCDDGEQPTPLYTAPPQPREPVRLTDEQITEIWESAPRWHAPPIGATDREFARAIEDAVLRANGIEP